MQSENISLLTIATLNFPADWVKVLQGLWLLRFSKNTVELSKVLWNCVTLYNDFEYVRKYHEGVHVANPVFDGATEDEIKSALSLAGVDEDGRTSCMMALQVNHSTTV